MMVHQPEPTNLSAFPLPTSTPLPSTYPCQLGSQHAKNNFKPRQFSRIPSSTESQAALKRTLQKYWGHANFRGPQLDICTHVLKGCDVLVVAPTGLGKSVCFQVPAVTIEYGITIVVSPLLALMRDQVSSLKEKGITAYQLSEKSSIEDIREVKRQLRMGHPQLRLLYVTPETLFSAKYCAEFDMAYRQRQITRLVIDEAHVIDEWGSTFRPTYRRLGEFRLKYPLVPITALTASATSEVRDDLTTILNMPKTKEQGLAQWVEPFNRKNLYYEVRYQGGGDRHSETVKDLGQFVSKFKVEAQAVNERHGVASPCVSGLVYCRLTADCENIAAMLNSLGVSARPFYAKQAEYKKNQTLDDWKAGRVECIVATIAFGMGVDQAHVRYVVHFDVPKSFEGYYQETGRAGRDGHMSRCVLYYSREDAIKLRGLIAQEANKKKKDGDDQSSVERGKLRMLNSFKSLQLYAESTSICRHVGICRFFGEDVKEITAEIKEKYCNGMCDVCTNRAGVFYRSNNLEEEAPIASPIVKPKPLEPAPEYVALATQAGRSSLAALQGTMALHAVSRPSILPPPTIPEQFELADEDFPAPEDIPAPAQETSVGRTRATAAHLAAVHPKVPGPSTFWATPANAHPDYMPAPLFTGRARTIDQLADDGIFGGVAITGDARSPEHAANKRKAREEAFRGVSPATPGGPFSFYNGSAPRKKGRVGGEFKVPLMETQRQATAGPVMPFATPTAVLPQNSVALSAMAPTAATSSMAPYTAPQLDRKAGLQKLQEALKLSFLSGRLADQVLAHWGRTAEGDKRDKLVRRVARELELDLAKIARGGGSYEAVVGETCDSLKLVRAPRGVELVVMGYLETSEDVRVQRLKHVETCFRKVK